MAPDDSGGKRGSRQHRSVRAVQGFIQELICGAVSHREEDEGPRRGRVLGRGKKTL